MKSLADKIRKTPEYKMGIGRATALYKARGDYKAGEAHKMAVHLVQQMAKKFHGPKYFEVYTPEVRVRVQKKLAQYAREDAPKLNHLLPKKYQKGFKGYDEASQPSQSDNAYRQILQFIDLKGKVGEHEIYQDQRSQPTNRVRNWIADLTRKQWIETFKEGRRYLVRLTRRGEKALKDLQAKHKAWISG